MPESCGRPDPSPSPSARPDWKPSAGRVRERAVSPGAGRDPLAFLGVLYETIQGRNCLLEIIASSLAVFRGFGAAKR